MAPSAETGGGAVAGAGRAAARGGPARSPWLRTLHRRRRRRWALVVLVLLSAALLRLGLSGFSDVTITLDAATERVAWELAPRADESPTVLRVPRGEATRFALTRGPDGRFRDELQRHRLEGASALAVQGPAELELRRAARGELAIRVTPQRAHTWGADAPDFAVEVYDGGELVATAHDTVTYVSRCGAGARAGDAPAPCADPVFRTLVRAERLVAGDHPTDPVHPAVAGESSSAASLAGALVAGRLRAFDRAVFYDTRYPLAEETLDGGDVVRLESGTGSATPRGRTAGVAEAGGRAASEAAAGASKNEDEAPAHATDDASLVWGSVTARFEEGDPHGSALQLVAHTRRHQVRVDRFGGGYLFGATRWDVLSSQPMVQAVWLGLVSFFLVVSGLQALRELVAPPDEGARADALAPASRLDTPAQPPGHAADADAVARWDGQGSETGPPAAAAVTGDARGAADDTAEAREEEEGRDARMRRPA